MKESGSRPRETTRNGQIRTSLQIKPRIVHPRGERTTDKWCCQGQEQKPLQEEVSHVESYQEAGL